MNIKAGCVQCGKVQGDCRIIRRDGALRLYCQECRGELHPAEERHWKEVIAPALNGALGLEGEDRLA